jgi:hypothetical protein
MPCVFCGYPETTNEHVFPQWLLEVIPGHGRVVHRWEALGSGAPSREWTTDVIAFKANVVCSKNCNSGWMSCLETEARPFLESMIRGRGRTLYGHGREVVAFWSLKTAMMIDFAQEAAHRSVARSDYPALYAAQAVLPNTTVWLGASGFGAGALARHRTLDGNTGAQHLATIAVPDALGRVHFSVDLGTADATQEYLPGATTTLTTRSVTFAPYAVVEIRHVRATRHNVRVCGHAIGGTVRARMWVQGIGGRRVTRVASTTLSSAGRCLRLPRTGTGSGLRGTLHIVGKDGYGHEVKLTEPVARGRVPETAGGGSKAAPTTSF